MHSNLSEVNNNEVTIVDNGELTTFTTEAETVIDALTEGPVQFGNFDELSVEFDEYVYDGIEIEINRATAVIINDGGTRFHAVTLESTVDDVLLEHEIEVGDDDELEVVKTAVTTFGEEIQINPANFNVLSDGVEIEVTRITFEVEYDIEEVVLETEYVYTDELLEGTREVRDEGIPQIVEHVMQTTLRNGEHYMTDEIETNIVDEGASRVVAIGTGAPVVEATPAPEVRPVSNDSTESNTSPAPVTPPPFVEAVDPLDSFLASVTAYLATCPGCSGRVACNGKDVTSNIHFNDATFGSVRIIAAGRQFPCGTIMDVEGIGHAVVLDRGGAVTGNVLDILMGQDSNPWQFGRQSLQAQVLRLGW